jgi:hypothetical protein
VLAKLYTESNTRCISAFSVLLDSRGEPTSNAIDFFVETRCVVCDAETSLNSHPMGATASKKQEKKRKILVAVAVLA